MPLALGTRLGPYEITGTLGAGGMGEVYRARDTRLKRDVALKILPESFATDPDRLARFQREAEVLASLNHPNIAAIYGLEETDDVKALVMELVEGPTLADRISPGAVPFDEALAIAKQIAEALAAAHEQGIIHRDLKPANIKMRSDGTVKVLDFGLAKALGPVEAGHYVPAVVGGDRSVRLQPDFTASPTVTSPALITGVGMLLGTAAYMSPEQAKGHEADKRSDIWAFGVVLYEMLTGKRPFDGEDVGDTLANVLKIEPDWSALPSDTPPALRTLLQRCLTKDRRRRVGDISTALFVLETGASLALPPGTVPVTLRPRKPPWQRLAVLTGGALVVVAVAGATGWLARWPDEPAPPRVSRLPIAFSPATTLTVTGIDRDVAITPDGSRVVYVGNSGTQLFVRALDALEPVAVFTGAPHSPFVSQDGQWIGFVDLNALKKVTVTGGPAVTLAAIGVDRGATWGPDDTIIFAGGNPNTGLQRISAAGGSPTVLTRADRAQGEVDHVWPELLPGGQAVLFTITTLTGGLDAAQIAVLDLRTGDYTILVRGGTHAQYLPSGHLVYAAAGTLRAVPFDLTTLEARGTPVPVISDVVTTRSGGVNAAMAGNGTLTYVSGTVRALAPRTLVWVDRSGHEEALKVPARAYVYPRLSPDGTRLAVEVRDQEDDIWIVNDLARTTLTRFSFGPATDRLPLWTPDGQRVVWSSARAGVSNLYWQAADGAGVIERLTQSSNPQFPSGYSPDGTRLVVREGAASRDLMVVAMDQRSLQASLGRSQSEPRQSQRLVHTPFVETSAEISPDGRWIAYQSDESGQDEIYVRPFPDVDTGRWQVSAGGGTKPLWARSGRELFYLVRSEAGAAVMSIPIERGASFAAGTPTKLMEGPYLYGTGGNGDTAFRTYDVSLDGRRFVMVREGGDTDKAALPTSLIVVQHWTEELKRLVPVN